MEGRELRGGMWNPMDTLPKVFFGIVVYTSFVTKLHPPYLIENGTYHPVLKYAKVQNPPAPAD
jgi:hypothetical protein